jgi:hypothetical protein
MDHIHTATNEFYDTFRYFIHEFNILNKPHTLMMFGNSLRMIKIDRNIPELR